MRNQGRVINMRTTRNGSSEQHYLRCELSYELSDNLAISTRLKEYSTNDENSTMKRTRTMVFVRAYKDRETQGE